MIRKFACAAALALAVFGQSDTAPTFQFADIHTSPHSSTAFVNMRAGFYRGGRYEVRSATMVDLIALAYGADADRVLSGPAWLETDRFDIIASAPPKSTPEDVKPMLQQLLADRFKLVVHIDKKEFPSYALVAGKQSHKLKEADGSGDTGCQFDIQGMGGPGGPDGPPAAPTFTFKCRNMTMPALVEYMHTMPAGTAFLGNNPILDDTGLKGAWNFEFHFTLPMQQMTPGAGSVLFDAVEKQLGLKLEPRKFPVPVIMVDSVNEKPTDNPPGVETKLPAAPTEFEVADIKPSDPNMNMQNRQQPFQAGGKLDLRGIPLKQIIVIAWDTTADKIIGGPKSLDDDKYDILAKAPAAATSMAGFNGSGNQPPVDIDALRLMLRALIIDRFKLKMHAEERPGQAYTLVAAKPKMKKADPANRTGFKEGPGPDGKDPRKDNPALGRLVTVQNMTMAQFAEAMPGIAGGYFQNASTTVIDATGVEGAYDFTLSFSPAGILRNNGGGGRGGDGPPAPAAGATETADPGGGITLFDAMEKQIGIKMEIQKRPQPVWVIDHIEPKPTDN